MKAIAAAPGLVSLLISFLVAVPQQRSGPPCDALPGISADFCPARQTAVVLPPGPSPQTVGWVDEKLEAMVDTKGRVSEVHLLEGAPGGSVLIAPVVKSWQFRPATDQGVAINSRVLVGAMFRPPLSYNGPAAGTPSVRLAKPSAEIPFPLTSTPPSYPALGVVEQAVVLVEVLVDPKGRVQNATLVRPAEGVNREALDAARSWSFRPAQRNSRPVPAYVYLIFGFRRPIAAG
jgi:TonB family protein